MEEALIVADPNSASWKFAQNIVDTMTERYGEVKFAPVEITRHNDGETKVVFPENLRRKEVFFIHDSSKRPNDWWVEALLVNDALKRASAKEIVDVIPYLPYSRQDRKEQSRVPISARVLADTLQIAATRIISMDLHCGQIQGFYTIPFDTLEAFRTICGHIRNHHSLENLVMCSTDAGGAKLATKYAEELGCRAAMAQKTRVRDGEVDKVYLLGDVDGKDVFVVDDMMDTSGTMIKVGEKLKKEGANSISAYATHPVFSLDAEKKLTAVYDSIHISDTIYREPIKRIETISMVDVFSKAIYGARTGESISGLFD